MGRVKNFSPANEGPLTGAKIWVHVDINSYFATLVQQENPALRGRPIGVIKSHNRTCVIAASKEAKKFGVKTGSYLKEALQLCPNLLTIPVDFDLCLDATRRLRRLLENLAPEVEIFSLDEAFIDLTSCSQLYPDPIAFGRQVQDQIKKELGEWVTCNVGISHSKLLAKLASEVSPKGSVTKITPENQDTYLARAKFEEVCGVGFRLSEKLARLNVFHPYQIHFVTDEELNALVGEFWTKQLRRIAAGQDPLFLQRSGDERPHMLSVGRSITGFKLCHSEQALKQTMYNLTDEVMYKVRRMKLAGRQVRVSMRGGEKFGQTQRWGNYVTLPHYLHRTDEMFKIVYYQLYGQWQRTFPIIKVSVGLSLLKPQTEVLEPLWPEWHQREKVAQAVDELAERYGLFTVRSGLLAKANLILPEVTGFLGDKAYQLDVR